jgi:hypothetical protein
MVMMEEKETFVVLLHQPLLYQLLQKTVIKWSGFFAPSKLISLLDAHFLLHS